MFALARALWVSRLQGRLRSRVTGVRKIRALTPVTPNTVELVPTLGALVPQGGPVRDPVLTPAITRPSSSSLLLSNLELGDTKVYEP